MSEPLDLDAAIAAAVTCIAGTDARELARTAVEAAAPLIERAVREQAAQELFAWADEGHDGTVFGPRAARRRHLHAAARKIAPEPTTEEIVQALREGRFVACYLDEAGRPIARDSTS